MSGSTMKILWNVIILVAVILYLSRLSSYPASETLFPRVVGIPVLGLTIMSLIKEGLSYSHTKTLLQHTRDKAAQISVGNLITGIALIGGYLVLWDWLGFVLDTIMFVAMAPLILRYGKGKTPLLVGIGIVVAFFFSFLFHLGSGAILPRGVLHLGWF